MHSRTKHGGGIAKTMDEVGLSRLKTMEAHRCQHLEEGVARCMTVNNLTIPEASWYIPLDIGKLERGLGEHFYFCATK